MNILITGASGFIGRVLMSRIKETGIFKKDNVIVLSSRKCISDGLGGGYYILIV